MRLFIVDDRSSSIAYSGSWARTSYTYAANKTLTRTTVTWFAGHDDVHRARRRRDRPA